MAMSNGETSVKMSLPKSQASEQPFELKQITTSRVSDDFVEASSEDNVKLLKGFNTVSTLALAVSLMATWETVCSTLGSGLVSGGPVSLVYGFLLSFIGNICTAASLGELASSYPSAGGQYYFVGKLSSAGSRAAFSWVSGWVTVLAWIVWTASAPFGAGTLIQGLLTLNYPDTYVPERWHGTMLYWAVLLVAFLINMYGTRLLPHIENGIATLHILFFFMMFIAILVISPTRNSAEFVFANFQNNTGWASNGVAWSLGMVTSAYVMVGYDSATHMSEEMREPRKGVPVAMIGSIVINGAMGFALLIAVLYGMGSLEDALATKTGFPIIQIFFYMTRGNLAATSAMTSTIILSASGATVGLLASASRTLFAFARDGAPPGSGWISRINKRQQVPINAVICTSVALVVFGLLNIASTTAFNAILSLTVESLALSYLLPIVMLLYRRVVTPEKLVWGPWRMPGWMGTCANCFSILYNGYICIFLLFPPFQPVTALNMNYASLLLGAVLLFCAVYWLMGANRTYTGPKLH